MKRMQTRELSRRHKDFLARILEVWECYPSRFLLDVLAERAGYSVAEGRQLARELAEKGWVTYRPDEGAMSYTGEAIKVAEEWRQWRKRRARWTAWGSWFGGNLFWAVVGAIAAIAVGGALGKAACNRTGRGSPTPATAPLQTAPAHQNQPATQP
jgi:hypothetical protein